MILVTETRAEAAKREMDALRWYSPCWVCVPCRRSFDWSDLRLHFKERCVLPYESLEFHSYYFCENSHDNPGMLVEDEDYILNIDFRTSISSVYLMINIK